MAGLIILLISFLLISSISNSQQYTSYKADDIEEMINKGDIIEDNIAIYGNLNLPNKNLNTLVITNSQIYGKINFYGSIFDNAASFAGTEFHEETNFEKVIFTRRANFECAQFNKNANFKDAQFKEEANFNNSKFEQNADFYNSLLKGDGFFTNTQFLGDANFRSSNFGSDTKFSSSKFLHKADFDEETIFGGNCNFNYVDFEDKANFNGSVFAEKADFKGVDFEERSDFESSTFKSISNFVDSTFKQDTSFSNSNFIGDAYFDNAKFKGAASFEESKFKQDTNIKFAGSIFEEDTNFRKVQFGGITNFYKAKFNNTDFSNSVFDSDVTFDEAYFFGKASFKGATFKGTPSLNSHFFNKLDLAKSKIQDMNMQGAVFEPDSSIDLTNAVFNNIYIKWDYVKDNLPCDNSVLIYLRESFKRRGDKDVANEIEIKRQECANTDDPVEWLIRGANGITTVHSTSISRTGITIAAVILLFALFYRFAGCPEKRKKEKYRFDQYLKFSAYCFFLGILKWREPKPICSILTLIEFILGMILLIVFSQVFINQILGL